METPVVEEKTRKLCIICSKGSLDMAYPPLILANAARMSGIEVDLFFTFWGLDMINKAKVDKLHVATVGVLRDLMAEQDLGATGRVDGETAARIGKLVGARYVFTGGFNDIEGQFRLDGRVVDVETSEVIRAEQVTDRRDRLYGIVVDVSNRVMDAVKLPPLTLSVRTERQSRASAIPREAVILYSQAQFFHDRGQTDRAKELYRRITNEFPRLTEAREALRQIEQGG
jgi:hypothetical protein